MDGKMPRFGGISYPEGEPLFLQYGLCNGCGNVIEDPMTVVYPVMTRTNPSFSYPSGNLIQTYSGIEYECSLCGWSACWEDWGKIVEGRLIE